MKCVYSLSGICVDSQRCFCAEAEAYRSSFDYVPHTLPTIEEIRIAEELDKLKYVFGVEFKRLYGKIKDGGSV